MLNIYLISDFHCDILFQKNMGYGKLWKMPIVGDRRYGSKFNTDGIMLYCGKLSFIHPVTHKSIEVKSIPTNGYFEIFGGIL